MAKKTQGGLQTINKLRNKYPSSGLASIISVQPEGSLWLPSSFIYLNYSMGGGIPYGKLLEVFGEESTGKSLLALDFAAVAQTLGGVVLWADAERSFDPRWAERNGLKLNAIELYPENSVEHISDWAYDMAVMYRAQLTHNEPIVLVIDSLAALDTLVNLDTYSIDQRAEMGNRAKAIYGFLRKRSPIFDELGICVIAINQLRKKIGATKWENPDTTTGGMAMRFYASQRLGLYGGSQIKDKINGFEERVGAYTTLRVVKNKVAPPRPSIKKCPVYFNPDYGRTGFSKYFGLADLLLRLGVLNKKKGGSVYKYGETTLANGETNFNKLIMKDAKLRQKLLAESGVNTVSKTRKQLANISENRYKVKVKKAKEEESNDE